MQLKREYAIPSGWAPEYGPDGTLLNAPPLKALHVRHTGPTPEQHFSRSVVDEWLMAGLATLGQGKLTLHTVEGDLVYTVEKTPGTYCCHCDARLPDDPSGASGKQHVETYHADTPSPDPQNPTGFRVTWAFETTLAEDQHAQWNVNAVTGTPAPPPRQSRAVRTGDDKKS